MKISSFLITRSLVCIVLLGAFLPACSKAQESTEAPEPPLIEWNDQAALEANIGNEVQVKGTILRVGNTSDNRVTFLNFGGPRNSAFVAVVFQQNYESFPHGFGEYQGQSVIIRGVLELFKNEQPQIRVQHPDQIKIGEPAEAAPVN